MKTIKVILSAAVVVLFLSGCSKTYYSYTSRSVAISGDVEIKPTSTIVDVRPDFTRRITAVSSVCKSVEEAMGEAKFKAIVDNKIDIVVDPIYKIQRSGSQGNRVVCTLSGFAGFYENPRTEMEDFKQIDSLSKETIEKMLMMKENPIILNYMYDKKEPASGCDQIIINHNSPCKKECAPKEEPAKDKKQEASKKK